jgi:cell division septation protein DedD
MLRRAFALVATLLGACATQPPPPPPAPEPPPVIISDQAQTETAAEPIVAEAPAAPQKPQQTDAGRFRVGVASLETAEAAAPWVSKLQAAGYRTEVLPVTIDGKTWHRVLLPGYANLEEARAAIPFVELEFGVQGVWVTSRRRAPTPAGAAAPEPAAEPAPAPEPTPAN